MTKRSALAASPPPTAFRSERILVIPDAHWPYVDRNAWSLAMRVGRCIQPKRIVVLGDTFDFYAVSSHDKSPARSRCLAEEIKESRQAVTDICALGADRVDVLLGNHENRLERYIARVAPALHGLDGLTAPELLGYKSARWTSHAYWAELKLGTTRLCHDYGEAGKYALARAVDLTDCDTIIGHTHRIAEHVATARKDGRTIRGMSFGWLGRFSDVDYIHRATANRFWAHGCGVGWTRADGSIRWEAVRFIDGKAKVDGCYV